jgi:hypothetical protein
MASFLPKLTNAYEKTALKMIMKKIIWDRILVGKLVTLI